MHSMLVLVVAKNSLQEMQVLTATTFAL